MEAPRRAICCDCGCGSSTCAPAGGRVCRDATSSVVADGIVVSLSSRKCIPGTYTCTERAKTTGWVRRPDPIEHKQSSALTLEPFGNQRERPRATKRTRLVLPIYICAFTEERSNQNQIRCVNVGEHMCFGSIVVSD